jgi:hypothetical protein
MQAERFGRLHRRLNESGDQQMSDSTNATTLPGPIDVNAESHAQAPAAVLAPPTPPPSPERTSRITARLKADWKKAKAKNCSTLGSEALDRDVIDCWGDWRVNAEPYPAPYTPFHTPDSLADAPVNGIAVVTGEGRQGVDSTPLPPAVDTAGKPVPDALRDFPADALAAIVAQAVQAALAAQAPARPVVIEEGRARTLAPAGPQAVTINGRTLTPPPGGKGALAPAGRPALGKVHPDDEQPSKEGWINIRYAEENGFPIDRTGVNGLKPKVLARWMWALMEGIKPRPGQRKLVVATDYVMGRLEACQGDFAALSAEAHEDYEPAVTAYHERRLG